MTADEAYGSAAGFLDRGRGIVGPWTMESFDETKRGWRLTYRHLEPERYAPAVPDGRGTLLVLRDTGEIEIGSDPS